MASQDRADDASTIPAHRPNQHLQNTTGQTDDEHLNKRNAPLTEAFYSITSPHDVVLGRLHGTPKEHHHDAIPHSNTVEGARPLLTPISTTRSQSTNPSNQKPPWDVLHDPFDGTTIGTLASPDSASVSDAQPITGGPIEGSRRNEDLWSHLSRVLELQNQVAKLHMEMEGVGPRAGDGKGKGRTPKRTPAGHRRDRQERKAHEGARSMGTLPDDPEKELDGDEGVESEDDEEGSERAREEEFARLADQFDGRKESIDEVMSKLDDLSKALTEFHSLQAPKIEFPNPSRNNSVGISPEAMASHQVRPPFNPTLTMPSIPAPEGVLTSSLSRVSPRKSGLPALIVNTMDSEIQQPHMVDSPTSTTGNALPQDTEPPV